MRLFRLVILSQEVGQHLLVVHNFHDLLVILHLLDFVLQREFELLTLLVLHHYNRVSTLFHFSDRLWRVGIELQDCCSLAKGHLQAAYSLKGITFS